LLKNRCENIKVNSKLLDLLQVAAIVGLLFSFIKISNVPRFILAMPVVMGITLVCSSFSIGKVYYFLGNKVFQVLGENSLYLYLTHQMVSKIHIYLFHSAFGWIGKILLFVVGVIIAKQYDRIVKKELEHLQILLRS